MVLNVKLKKKYEMINYNVINKNEMHMIFFFREKIGSNAYIYLIKIEINLCMKKGYLISNIERY